MIDSLNLGSRDLVCHPRKKKIGAGPTKPARNLSTLCIFAPTYSNSTNASCHRARLRSTLRQRQGATSTSYTCYASSGSALI